MTYIDKCLWDYKANIAAIDWLRDEIANLSSLHAQDYDFRQGSGVSDPVGNLVSKCQYMEGKIRKLESITRPITRMYEELSGSDMAESQMREILKLRFFDHESRSVVIRKMSISDATYIRRCSAIKGRARKYFGEQ